MNYVSRLSLPAVLVVLLLASEVRAGGLGPRGDDFAEPPVWVSRNHVLSGNLVVARARTRLGDRVIDTLTYNRRIPGPTWVVEPGDDIRVRLINHANPSKTAQTIAALCPAPAAGCDLASALLGEGGMVAAEDPIALHTNMHTHGLQVDPRGNSDNVYLDIAPGRYFDYLIKIPRDQPAGLYFYHPHRHMAVARQFWNGMAGAIIVKGGIDELLAVRAAKDLLLVINELLLDGYGQVPAPTLVPTAGRVPFAGLPPVPTDIYFPINGVLMPRITMRPGEIQRWRVVNAAAHRFIDLAIETHPRDTPRAERVPLHQIAQDGINFGASLAHTNLLMAPANRVEFMVQIGRPGTYYLNALKFDQGHPGGPRPTVVLATVVVEGHPMRPTTTFPLRLIPPQQDALVPRRPGDDPPKSVWSGQIEVKPVSFSLDGGQFDPTQPRPGNRDVPVGFTEEWVLQNHDVFRHPFHIHVNPFQVLEINGQPTPLPRVWWDTLALPPKGSVKLLMPFRPSVAGKTVFHCHILPHEDAGMMAVLSLRSPAIPFTISPVGPFDCSAAEGACPPFKPDEPEFTPSEQPYVFTHLANQFGAGGALPAAINRGSTIQIQLPGDSGKGGTTWSVTLQGNAIVPRGADFVSSIGQFEGANGIYEFNFAAVKEGSVTVRATTQKPFPWDPAHGQFVLALDVVPPDAIEGRTGRGTFPLNINRPHVHGAARGGDRHTISGMSIAVQRPAAPQNTAGDDDAGARSP